MVVWSLTVEFGNHTFIFWFLKKAISHGRMEKIYFYDSYNYLSVVRAADVQHVFVIHDVNLVYFYRFL
jgi:hypothetical protein